MMAKDSHGLPWGRVGAFLLPFLALAWFVGIVVSTTWGHEYVVDAKTQRISPTANVIKEVGPTVAAAGAQVGDIIDRSTLPLALKLRANAMAARGEPVQFPVIHDGKLRMITAPAVRPISEIPAWEKILSALTAAFSLSLLAFVGYRRPSLEVGLLIFFVGGALLSWPHFMSMVTTLPDAWFGPLGLVMRTLCGLVPVMLLASFAIRLGADRSARRRMAVFIIDAIVVFGVLTDWLAYQGIWQQFQMVASGVLLLIASCVALAWAKPSDRNRIGILFSAIMVGGVGYAAAMFGSTLGISFTVFIFYTTLSVIIIPLALAYAILRHRVFDITFILNRTLVYALTSAILLVVFAALEFAAERYLRELTHIASVIVEFVIALVVIVSARLMHSRVDRFVDSVLFRSRHEQELALRRFATTVQSFTDQVALVRIAVEILERYGSVTGAAIYLTGGGPLERVAFTFNDPPHVVDENDLAYVELRAHRTTLDLHSVDTALPGARLYPMTLSGRLVGAIAIGERHGGEQMPPDIDDAIARVAESIAISIAAIETDAVRQENALLQQRLNVLAPAN